MELRVRPKDDYLYKASWNQLYILTKHWRSDIDFYRDELRFLRDLIGKYFIWLVKDENIGHVSALANKLTKTGRECEDLEKKLAEHLKQLEKLVEGTTSNGEKEFREEHIELEDTIADFTKSFRLMKKEVFSITEHVIEEEKLNRLLMP